MFEVSYQIVSQQNEKSGQVCRIKPIYIGGFITSRHVLTCLDMSRHVLLFFEWKELIGLHHIDSYEKLRIIIWHGLNLENFQNLDNLENLEHFENWLVRAFTSDLGLNAFESC